MFSPKALVFFLFVCFFESRITSGCLPRGQPPCASVINLLLTLSSYQPPHAIFIILLSTLQTRGFSTSRSHAYIILAPLNPTLILGFTGIYLLKNIDYGYSLEPPSRGGSNEYPQSMF